MHNSCGIIIYIYLHNNEDNWNFRQTCVVEVGQQLFFLHEPLIKPVSQGRCLHRNLFHGVHPDGKERRGDGENTKKDYWGLTQQKLSALICCERCSPNPGCQPRSLTSSLFHTGIYYSRLSVCCSFRFRGFHLADRLVSFRVRQTCRVELWQETRHVAPQNGSVRSVWEENVGDQKKKIWLNCHY